MHGAGPYRARMQQLLRADREDNAFELQMLTASVPSRFVAYRVPEAPPYPTVLFFALYPPAGASVQTPHVNATCLAVEAVLRGRHFMFVDMVPLSPRRHSGDLTAAALRRALNMSWDRHGRLHAHRSLAGNAVVRTLATVDYLHAQQGDQPVVVAVCGNEAARNWERCTGTSLPVDWAATRCHTPTGAPFALVRILHPSAHMRGPHLTARFTREMLFLHGLASPDACGRACVPRREDHPSFVADMAAWHAMWACTDGYSASVPEAFMAFLSLDASFLQLAAAWVAAVGPRAHDTLQHRCVCLNLFKPAFLQQAAVFCGTHPEWASQPEVVFQNAHWCAALAGGDARVIACAHAWMGALPSPHALRLLTCPSFTRHMNDDEFFARAHAWADVYGPVALVDLVRNCPEALIDNDAFADLVFLAPQAPLRPVP